MRVLIVLLLTLPAAAGCASAGKGRPVGGAPEPAPVASFVAQPTHWRTMGRSAEGRPIQVVEFGSGSETVLILGGFHGDEKTACRFVIDLCERFATEPELTAGRRVVVVPLVNPDGYAARTRVNAHGVDVNRNFPTANWQSAARSARYNPGSAPTSEPETRLVMELVERLRPARILSIHDPLKVNNWDGPGAESIAQAMAAHNGYPVKGYIGYPTPGSFGTWAGIEGGIPVVTLEVEPGRLATEHNLGAIVAAVQHVGAETRVAALPTVGGE